MYVMEKLLIFAQMHINNLPDGGSVRNKTSGSLQQLIFHRYWWSPLWKVITRPIKTGAGLWGSERTIAVRGHTEGHSRAVNWPSADVHVCVCVQLSASG